ncbi:ethanolamine utilization microcompartment protein EutL [Desulfitibacter alkalitolerans]|uniref:ethanolamine utilization microcompartment protein EutL n=1 Tax=Desulfitibacter alkalitolerans TaxID=264641 RepID=UPI00048433DC|nr:ethanolamine utilization microcompartment protein EutL [Desulfitibacter alkalitolerans]
MAILEPVKAKVLSVKFIPNVSAGLAESMKLKPNQNSIGFFSCDIDDVAYTAIDEATKKADVEVVYADSFYAGAANASTPLAGEFIGVLAGPDPAEVRAGIEAAVRLVQEEAFFYTANEEGTISFYAYTISRTGSYLSKMAGVNEGDPICYLIAPPVESTFGVDAALKAADVKMGAWFGPPTRTNFGGALLSGSQSACKAAADAFRDAVLNVARSPLDYLG